MALNNPFQRHALSMASVEVYYGAARPTLTWNGVQYPCTGGAAEFDRLLGLGGYELNIDLVVNIRLSLFVPPTTIPMPKNTITYTGPEFPNGQLMRIEDLVRAPGGPFITLHLKSIAEGE